MAEMDKEPIYHVRKAKWHEARADSTGDQNVADSHRQSAMLKSKLTFDDMKDNPGRNVASYKQDFAFRG